MRFFNQNKLWRGRFLSRQYLFTIPLFFLFSSALFFSSFLSLSNYQKSVSDILYNKSRQIFKQTSDSIFQNKSSALSSKIDHEFAANNFVRNTINDLLEERIQLEVLNDQIVKNNLFDQNLVYRKDKQILTSEDDSFGQSVLWKDSIKFLPDENGVYSITYDKSYTEHLNNFLLIGPILRNTYFFSDETTFMSFGGPFEKPYSYVQQNLSEIFKRELYPAYLDTNRWKHFIPPVKDFWSDLAFEKDFDPSSSKVMTPFYIDALTGRKCFTLLSPVISDKKIEGRLNTDFYEDRLESIFLDNLSKNKVLWLTDSKYILNYSEELNQFLGIEEKAPHIMKGNLNRYVTSYRLGDSKYEKIQSLECSKKPPINESLVTAGKKYSIECKTMELNDFYFVSDEGIRRENLYLVFFREEPESNYWLDRTTDSLARQMDTDSTYSLFFISLLIILLSLFFLHYLLRLKNSIYLHVYQDLYNQKKFIKRLRTIPLATFQYELEKIKERIGTQKSKSTKNRDVIKRLTQGILRTNEAAKAHRFTSFAENLAQIRSINTHHDLYLVGYISQIESDYYEEIDNLFIANTRDKNEGNIPLNFSLFLSNYFNTLVISQNHSIFEFNNDIELNLLVNSNKTVLRSLAVKSFERVIKVFSFSQVTLSAALREKNLDYEIEFNQIKLNDIYIGKSSVIQAKEWLTSILERNWKNKRRLLAESGIADIYFAQTNEENSLKLIISFSNDEKSITEETPETSIYSFSSNEVFGFDNKTSFYEEPVKNTQFIFISDEGESGLSLLNKETYSSRKLELCIHQGLIKDRAIFLMIDCLSFSLDTNVLLQRVLLISEGENIRIYLIHPSKVSVANNASYSFITNTVNQNILEELLIDFNNYDKINSEIENFKLVDDVSNFPVNARSVEQDFEKILGLLKNTLKLDVYFGKQGYFFKNKISENYQNKFFRPPHIVFDEEEKNKSNAILRTNFTHSNLVLSKPSCFDSFEKNYYTYLACQLVNLGQKFLNLSNYFNYLKVFQNLLQKLDHLIAVKRISDEQSKVYYSTQTEDAETEVVQMSFYAFRKNLSPPLKSIRDELLVNPDKYSIFKEKISEFKDLESEAN